MKTLKIIQRHCRCGCGKTWKTTSSSKSKYFSLLHDPKHKLVFDKVRKVGRGKKNSPRNIAKMFEEFDRTIDDDDDSH